MNMFIGLSSISLWMMREKRLLSRVVGLNYIRDMRFDNVDFGL